MVSDEKIQRLGRTIGLLHAALRFARQGGMPETAAKDLNELVARLFGDSVELDVLKQQPSPKKRVDSKTYRPIVECAIELLCTGKKRRGMAGIIKRKLRLRLSTKQILRILDEQMPRILEQLTPQK